MVAAIAPNQQMPRASCVLRPPSRPCGSCSGSAPNRTICMPPASRSARMPPARNRRYARASGCRTSPYSLSVQPLSRLERCHPADPDRRRAREAVAARTSLRSQLCSRWVMPRRGGFAVRAVRHDSPGPALWAPGTPQAEWTQETADSGDSWERSGNHQRSPRLCAAPFCSPVHGRYLRDREGDQVTVIGMHGWGSRGRRFKSGRPDQPTRLVDQGSGPGQRAFSVVHTRLHYG